MMISCFQELRGRHPGDAHHAQDQQATVDLGGALRTEPSLADKNAIEEKFIFSTLNLLFILVCSSEGIFNESEYKHLN